MFEFEGKKLVEHLPEPPSPNNQRSSPPSDKPPRKPRTPKKLNYINKDESSDSEDEIYVKPKEVSSELDPAMIRGNDLPICKLKILPAKISADLIHKKDRVLGGGYYGNQC
jgi:hypothetical protein